MFQRGTHPTSLFNLISGPDRPVGGSRGQHRVSVSGLVFHSFSFIAILSLLFQVKMEYKVKIMSGADRPVWNEVKNNSDGHFFLLTTAGKMD